MGEWVNVIDLDFSMFKEIGFDINKSVKVP